MWNLLMTCVKQNSAAAIYFITILLLHANNPHSHSMYKIYTNGTKLETFIASTDFWTHCEKAFQ
jgi:hypothetical protein